MNTRKLVIDNNEISWEWKYSKTNVVRPGYKTYQEPNNFYTPAFFQADKTIGYIHSGQGGTYRHIYPTFRPTAACMAGIVRQLHSQKLQTVVRY